MGLIRTHTLPKASLCNTFFIFCNTLFYFLHGILEFVSIHHRSDNSHERETVSDKGGIMYNDIAKCIVQTDIGKCAWTACFLEQMADLVTGGYFIYD